MAGEDGEISRLAGVGETPTPRPGDRRCEGAGWALDFQAANLKKIGVNLRNLRKKTTTLVLCLVAAIGHDTPKHILEEVFAPEVKLARVAQERPDVRFDGRNIQLRQALSQQGMDFLVA